MLQRHQLKLKQSSKMNQQGGDKNEKTAQTETTEDQPEKPESKANSENSGKTAQKKKSFKKPMKKRTKKRAKQERQYTPIRKKFLKEHPVCEIGDEGCTSISTEIHHAGGREGDRLLKLEDFKAVCHNCHTKATEKSREAIAAGHSKTRLGKPDKTPANVPKRK